LPTVPQPTPAEPEPVEFSLAVLNAESGLGDVDSWGDSLHASVIPLLPELTVRAPEVVSRLTLSQTALPQVGSNFLNFQLLAELGRGAFGRVFLARQGGLADRLVALKISTESLAESQKLAQLQHSHIVPIYSYHQAGPIQAVCMPFLGSTTLADVLFDLQQRQSLPVSGKGLVSTLHERKSRTAQTLDSLRSAGSLPPGAATPTTVPGMAARRTGTVAFQQLEGLTYVEAVLWLGVRLADGLAHAHDRGILHRDLKPANILLTDDGQPLLLDFNLAEDIKQGGGALSAMLGGTLPYMSPEHLDAFLGHFQTVDHRSDIYALGLILVELLLGRHPFTRFQGPPEVALPKMSAERRRGTPNLRLGNPAISPAVEAILCKCLDPDPAGRYETAHDLHEDLERQLGHQPLRYTPEPSLGERLGKWARRHPKLTSGTTVGAFFAVLVLVFGISLGVWWHQAVCLADEKKASDLARASREAQIYLAVPTGDQQLLTEGATRARQILAPLVPLERDALPEVPGTLSPEKQEAFRAHVGQMFLVLAATETNPERALKYNDRAARCLGDKGVPRAVYLQRAGLLDDLKRDGERDEALRKAEGLEVRDSWEYLFEARELRRRVELVKAIEDLKAVVEKDRTNLVALALLGDCYLEAAALDLARDTDTLAVYTKLLVHLRDFYPLWVNRGVTYIRLRDYENAERDFNEALKLRPDLVEVYLHLAVVHEALKKPEQALADVEEAIRRGFFTHRSLLVRARLRAAQGDLAGSKEDRDQALALEPTDEEGFVARGCARLAKDIPGALADFRAAVSRNRRSLPGHLNQAHVFAEMLNQPREAIGYLDTVVRLYPKMAEVYAVRGVLYARLGERDAALRDARRAEQLSQAPETLYQVAGIYARLGAQNPADKEKALALLATALQGNYGIDLLATDPELDAIRLDPRYVKVVEAARTLAQQAGGRN
jgi:serine/threonine protein kinase/tetratricopeptide (TPR) repeat protein